MASSNKNEAKFKAVTIQSQQNKGWGASIWDNKLRGSFKKKNCIFYDIWQKGIGSKDQNQISEKNLNLDKVLGVVGKRLQCHKNSYLKNLVFYCLFCQKISIFHTPLSSLWHFYYYNCLCLWHLLLLQLLLHR